MKNNILSGIKLTLVTILFFSGVYTFVICFIAKVSPDGGKGITVKEHNVLVGYENIGQKFKGDNYFQGRPSAVDYNAAGSGASNKGPSNKEYLDIVKARIDTFLIHNPEINKKDIPVELVTASGSGLDPNLSVKAAMVQVPRISKIRNKTEKELYDLIDSYTEKPLLGMFGPEKINMLKLNIALNAL